MTAQIITMLLSIIVGLEANIAIIETAEATTTPPVVELSVEEKIIKELGPEFIAIAKCESGIRQFNDDGTVLISRTSDIGIFQINQVHWQRAKDLGIDINTVDGNIAYAKILKEERGKADWFMSEYCWKK